MTTPSERPKRGVLIVDDARLMRTMLRGIVTRAGWAVVGEAADGDEAVRLYFQVRPDAVTMDILMPRVDGLTAARQILERDPAARIVMITSVGQEDIMRRCIELGAVDFIIKPLQEDRILAALRRVLEHPDQARPPTAPPSTVARSQ